MFRFFNYIFVIIALVWLIPASAGPAKVVVDKEFSLGIGQSASIDGEKPVIKFKAVLEDSRCPLNVLCVWAGNGKIEFEVLDIDERIKTIILNTEDEPRLVALKRHKLKLVSLNPPRTEGVSISPEDYSVILRVERIESTS